MYVYIIRVYRMYMYLYIIYSYIRVPRVVARVCRTYVISGVCPLAQSGLCVLTCCLWKGEKTRNSAESDERKHHGDATKRDRKKSPSSSCCQVVVVVVARFRKKTRIGKEARRARCSGTASYVLDRLKNGSPFDSFVFGTWRCGRES